MTLPYPSRAQTTSCSSRDQWVQQGNNFVCLQCIAGWSYRGGTKHPPKRMRILFVKIWVQNWNGDSRCACPYPAHIPSIAAIALRNHWASMRQRISFPHIKELLDHPKPQLGAPPDIDLAHIWRGVRFLIEQANPDSNGVSRCAWRVSGASPRHWLFRIWGK